MTRHQLFTMIALFTFSVFIGTLLALHSLRPDYDPLAVSLGAYASGQYGFWFGISLFMLALGSMLTRAILRESLHNTPRLRLGLSLMFLWGIGTLFAGIFAADPVGITITYTGTVHGISTTVAYIAIVGAMWLLTLEFRDSMHWSGIFLPSIILAIGSTIGLGYVFLPVSLRGAGEKAFVAFVLIWFIWLVLHAWRINTQPQPD